MKLQLTTLLYFVSNLIFITLRTIQILCFTEADTAFLTPSSLPFSIAFVAIAVLLLVAVFTNALYKPRMPKEVKAKTKPCLGIAIASGVLYAVSGTYFWMTNESGGFFFVVSLAAALTTLLYGFTEYLGFEFPRVATVVLIGVWVYEFILSYLFYSTRALRFRTILETLAIAFVLLFFIAFGKLKSGVKQTRNIQLLYPLGLVASTLCFVSLIPEAIAIAVGQSSKVSQSCVSQAALLSAGIFTAFISLYCFKRKPKNAEEEALELLELEAEDMPFYMEPAENFRIYSKAEKIKQDENNP